MNSEAIVYKDYDRPDVDVIAALYKTSNLQRPVEDRARLQRMYDHSPLVLTAWDRDRLVGILRGWSDGGFVGYIADLAVDPRYQGQGIGKKLLDLAIETNSEVQFALRAADAALNYYAHLGWTRIDNGWYWPRTS